MMFSESQEAHISSVFLEYHPPSKTRACAAAGAEAAAAWLGDSLPIATLH